MFHRQRGFNSPGWGYVHHASNAVFHDNASFDTHGAGFVAETGDEIGSSGNIAIKAEGTSLQSEERRRRANYDMARTGAGFWFQAAWCAASGNIAASVNQGFVYCIAVRACADCRARRSRSRSAAAHGPGESGPSADPQLPRQRGLRECGRAVRGEGHPNQGHDITPISRSSARGSHGRRGDGIHLALPGRGFDGSARRQRPSAARIRHRVRRQHFRHGVSRARIENFPLGIRLGKISPTRSRGHQQYV